MVGMMQFRCAAFSASVTLALTKYLPEHVLKIGDIGVILHIYADHKGYEVKFVTLNGELIALVSV